MYIQRVIRTDNGLIVHVFRPHHPDLLVIYAYGDRAVHVASGEMQQRDDGKSIFIPDSEAVIVPLTDHQAMRLCDADVSPMKSVMRAYLRVD